MDIVTYALCQTYVKRTAEGLGAVRGKPCTIQSISEVDNGHIVTFKWTGDTGTVQTSTMFVRDGGAGVGIVTAVVNAQNHLIITLSDGSTVDAGAMSVIAKLSYPITATENIGSVTSGKTYATGTNLEDIIKDILVKYQPPAVTLTTTPATKLYDIVNDSISTILLKGAVTKKSKPVTKVSFYVGDTLLNEVTTGVADGGNFQYQYNPATPIRSDVTFKASTTDGTQATSSTVTIKFVGKSYYGVCDADVSDPTETIIKSGSNTLKDTKTFIYNGITTNWGKVFYAYPKSFGALSSIKDEVNNINYWDSFQRSEVSVDNIDYYCYTLIEPTAAEDNSITFK